MLFLIESNTDPGEEATILWFHSCSCSWMVEKEEEVRHKPDSSLVHLHHLAHKVKVLHLKQDKVPKLFLQKAGID